MSSLPENYDWKDVSHCHVSPTCLNCPLPVCKHDGNIPGGNGWLEKIKNRERHRAIVADVKARIASGEYKRDARQAVADAYDMTDRSVTRLMKEDRDGELEERQPPTLVWPNRDGSRA